MKYLLFMRHGEPDYRSDRRGLTKEGMRQAQSAADQAIASGIRPEVVVSSDLPRAVETAQVLVETLRQSGVEASLSADPRLRELEAVPKETPSGEGIRGVLCGIDDKYQTVAIVGHKDELAQAVYLLTGKSVSFRYANAVLVECYEDSWTRNAASGLNNYKTLFEPK